MDGSTYLTWVHAKIVWIAFCGISKTWLNWWPLTRMMMSYGLPLICEHDGIINAPLYITPCIWNHVSWLNTLCENTKCVVHHGVENSIMFTNDWEAITQLREGKVSSTQQSLVDATQHDLDKNCTGSIQISWSIHLIF